MNRSTKMIIGAGIGAFIAYLILSNMEGITAIILKNLPPANKI